MLKVVFKTLLIVALLFVSHPLYAFQGKCDGSIKDYAVEIIKLELSGARMVEKSKCLDEKNFKYITTMHDPGEAGEQGFTAIPNFAETVVSQPVLIDRDIDEYSVDFVIKWKEGANKTEIKDNLIFIVHTDESAQKISGCADELRPPSKVLVLKKCTGK